MSANASSTQASFIPGTKGKQLLLLNRFKFCENRTLTSEEIKWRCSIKSCAAWVKTWGRTTNISDSNLTHNHEPLSKKQEMKQLIAGAAKRKARDDLGEKPSVIFRACIDSEAAENLTEEDVRNVKQAIYRERRKKTKEVHEALDEMDDLYTARASVKKEALLDVSTKPADIISRTTPGNLDEDGVASLRRAIYRTRVAVQKKTSQEPLLDSGTPLTADDVIDEVDCGLLEPKLEIPDPEYEKNENHTAIAGATCETSASDDISSKYQSRARGQQPSVSSLPSTGSLNAEDPNNLPESAEEELGFDNEEVYEPESKRVKVEAIEYMGFESEAPCSSTSRGESRLSNESFELKPILDGTHNFGDNEAFESQTDKSSLVIPKPCTNQPGPSPKTGVRTAPALERNDLFGEYVAAKLRSLKTDAARNRVECLIANILYEASKGTFDDAVTTADITNIIQAYLTSTKDLQFSDSAVTKPSTSMLTKCLS
ncbi:hypothetical protein GE061_004849 [Apolygus lucorum]|uniref:FLYWCH-type domain-containing protein n=1 Tax=Apolygus lucorum TaxID=248454 RepID=A0A8S9X1U7_APOLU|nr:hypothetical protein GE061_004849 [Apolygus lucorum]